MQSAQEKEKFKNYPVGYFHIAIATVRTEDGKLNLFVAIDRTSKFVCVELHARCGKREAEEFLRNTIAAVPYRIHTVLTDNGIQFTNCQKDKRAFVHIFDRICQANGMEHWLNTRQCPDNPGVRFYVCMPPSNHGSTVVGS